MASRKYKVSTLLEVAKESLYEYGSHILYNRAIPDARDGLIPVQRAQLVAARDLGLSSTSGYVKSARISGEVMGRYHPHGDSYGVLVNLAQMKSPMPLIDGKGNWGGVGGQEGAAAPRYTEARITKFAESMIDDIGLSVVDHIPNYDDTKQLPLVLPAREPYLLYNGFQGIGLGTTCGVPPFERKGVLSIVIETIENNAPPSIKTLLKHLKLNYIWGGINVTEKDQWKAVLETGRGSIKIAPEIEQHGDKLHIVGIPPYFDLEKATEKIMELDGVRYVQNQSTDKLLYVVAVKRGVDMGKLAEQIAEKCSSRFNVALNVVIRKKREGSDEPESQFFELTFSQFFKSWCDYRVRLEKRILEEKLRRVEAEIAKHDLLLLAIKHLDALVKLIRRKYESREALVKAVSKLLKVNSEDAEYVLRITLGKLSSLESSEVQAARKKLLNQKNHILKALKNPASSAVASLKEALL